MKTPNAIRSDSVVRFVEHRRLFGAFQPKLEPALDLLHRQCRPHSSNATPPIRSRRTTLPIDRQLCGFESKDQGIAKPQRINGFIALKDCECGGDQGAVGCFTSRCPIRWTLSVLGERTGGRISRSSND
jgi:hypothetical protein